MLWGSSWAAAGLTMVVFGGAAPLALAAPPASETETADAREDYRDLASVKAFADRVATVDLLVLNAGIMALNQKELTVDGFEKQIGVNHFGHAYLTRLLRPKLEARGTATQPSRVVVVASTAHGFAAKEWTAQDLDLERLLLPFDGRWRHDAAR